MRDLRLQKLRCWCK